MSRQNLCPNPALAVDLTGWNADATLSRVDVTGEGFPRNWAGRRTGSGPLRSALATVAAGTVYTASGYVRSSASGSGQWFITWLDAGQNFIANSTGASTFPAGSVFRPSLTDTAPDGAAFARFAIQPPDAASTAEMTAVLIEASSSLGSYADGETAGWKWDGADGLSTSSEARVIQPLFVQSQAIVTPPQVPSITMAPPVSSSVVVPVAGPKGDKGDPGSVDDLAAIQGMIDTSVTVHVVAPEPHPAYDDMPDLTLIFQNGLV